MRGSTVTARSTRRRRATRCAGWRSTTRGWTQPTASCSRRSSRSSRAGRSGWLPLPPARDSADGGLLAAIVRKLAGGPVGVAALAAVLSEEVDTIEDVHEPFLLRLGFIDPTPPGRTPTPPRPPHPPPPAPR